MCYKCKQVRIVVLSIAFHLPLVFINCQNLFFLKVYMLSVFGIPLICIYLLSSIKNLTELRSIFYTEPNQTLSCRVVEEKLKEAEKRYWLVCIGDSRFDLSVFFITRELIEAFTTLVPSDI